MATIRIVLAGACPPLQGLTWETQDQLRIGRQDSMDIVLQDLSVSRMQAEVVCRGGRWVVRDLANSDKMPTYLNGMPLQNSEAPLGANDLLQFGRMKLKVAAVEGANSNGVPPPELLLPPDAPAGSVHLKTTGAMVKVQATAHRSWDEAMETVALDPRYHTRQGAHLLTLLRAGHHLRHLSSLDELLHSVLDDSIKALDAQRGAIVLADRSGELQLRALLAPRLPKNQSLGYSRTLAQRCFAAGESLLCQDVRVEEDILSAASVRRGAMSSIICAVLRSPRKQLGVMHLDRGPFHEPFTPYDFHLADAIAASVAVGIESALLVEQQREEFIQSVTSLARTVELRDQYTGDHTRRVTEYSLMLARELNLPPAEVYHIQIGTPLHDIGKIGVDDAILRKPGKLTPEEFEVMKTHTVKGALILQSMANLTPMIPIVRHHHERWDGTGYPDGLSFNLIPQTARVVAVADAFDAMTSNRPYRKAMSAVVAFEELQKNAGTHFDPRCVEAFLKLRARIEQLMRE
jgi:HD-GYP domain-containing protein (c-di-GMP phosphodiesterase class II)